MKKHAILRENNDLCVQVEATNSKDLMSSLSMWLLFLDLFIDSPLLHSTWLCAYWRASWRRGGYFARKLCAFFLLLLLLWCLLSQFRSESSKDNTTNIPEFLSCRTLLFAATDTSSSAILRTLLVLAEHHDIQARVRQEILAAKLESDGDLSYDKLLALPLLDAVYRETMRLLVYIYFIFHSFDGFVDTLRHPISIECESWAYPHCWSCLIIGPSSSALEDTVLPLAFPIIGSDGKRLSKILVPKNTVLTVSIVGVNRSTAIWGSDALEWKPQRWLGELPASVKDSCMPGIYSHMCVFLPSSPRTVLMLSLRTGWHLWMENAIACEYNSILTPASCAQRSSWCSGYRYVQMELSKSAAFSRHVGIIQIFRFPAEIVISELICTLQFARSSSHDKISWPMGITLSPFVDGKMCMPLEVSRVWTLRWDLWLYINATVCVLTR